MRAGGGKQKGAAFEREVCVRLSLWLTSGKREDVLWRSAMSGGRATVRSRIGKNTNAQLGDISSITPEGHKLTDRFVVEAKFYADLDLEAFVFKNAGKLYGFWQEVARIARQNRKYPMLVAKQNRMPALLISTPAGIETLGLFDHGVIAALPTAKPCAHVVFFETLQGAGCPL